MVAPHGLRQSIRRADWQANCGRHTRTHQQRSRRCRTEPCRAKEKEPLSAQILSGIISATDVPFSSYVAHPRTPLHYVDARLKQLWLLALLLLIPRLPWQARVSVVAGVLLLSVVCLPRRLCVEQLKRLLPLALLLTGLTALTADQAVAEVPAASVPADVVGMPSLEPLTSDYKYILFKFAFISVSRFSLSLAVSVGAVAFSALQSTSMFLVTTPPEQMALAFRWFATPLAWLGAPVQRTTFLLLLSLRFVSLVFEEVRNLCLGLAARAVPWKQRTRSHTIAIWVGLINKLFANLFARSRYIAESLRARGVVDFDTHQLNIPQLLPPRALHSACAAALLLGGVWLAFQHGAQFTLGGAG